MFLLAAGGSVVDRIRNASDATCLGIRAEVLDPKREGSGERMGVRRAERLTQR